MHARAVQACNYATPNLGPRSGPENGGQRKLTYGPVSSGCPRVSVPDSSPKTRTIFICNFSVRFQCPLHDEFQLRNLLPAWMSQQQCSHRCTSIARQHFAWSHICSANDGNTDALPMMNSRCVTQQIRIRACDSSSFTARIEVLFSPARPQTILTANESRPSQGAGFLTFDIE